jgi:hypothetical protein
MVGYNKFGLAVMLYLLQENKSLHGGKNIMDALDTALCKVVC